MNIVIILATLTLLPLIDMFLFKVRFLKTTQLDLAFLIHSDKLV
jgi:hypothetical protein